MEQFEKVLNEIYYDPKHPASFGGGYKLFREAKKILPDLSIANVKNWLKKQNTYSLFKQVKNRFKRLPIRAISIDHQWQADLLDMTWFAKYNDRYKYILVVVDVLSRYAWAIPQRDKSGQTTADAMESIFDSGRVPKKLQTDQGKEFKNKIFKEVMKKYGINFFTTTEGVIKCAIAERFNRTLRSRIYRYLYHNNTKRYIDVLPSIIMSYNKSFHRSIKMTPDEVNKDNEATVIKNLKVKPAGRVKDTLAGEDFVRMSREKKTFEKGTTENFNEEIFKIQQRKKTPHKYVYRLVDLDDEPITSIFYPEELVAVEKPSQYKARVTEHIQPNGKKKYHIHYIGFPEKYDTWIDG